MAEIKKKVVLKTKGEEAYISVKQLMVSLKWTARVDLDLMAFYRTKDDRVGGIYSENYSGGSFGNLNAFPFIQLSGDAGVGAAGGENEEVIRITKLDDMKEIYICALNFTDALQQKKAIFSNYDAVVTVIDDKGEAVEVPLRSRDDGAVALIARIDNTGFMGPRLINENRVMELKSFQETLPGAHLLQIQSKIVLKKKGESFELKSKMSGGGLGEIMVNLNWNQQPQQQKKGILSKLLTSQSKGIDLDLGCLVEFVTGQKGAIQPLGNALGAFEQPPFILHCGDDRTGSWAQGENLRINGNSFQLFKRILVYTYIYEGVARWSDADAVVTIKQPGSPDVQVFLDEHRDGIPMCAIALLENTGQGLKVQKIVEYFEGHSQMDKRFNWGLQWVAGSKD
jgi:tellurite resistance protein TerA